MTHASNTALHHSRSLSISRAGCYLFKILLCYCAAFRFVHIRRFILGMCISNVLFQWIRKLSLSLSLSLYLWLKPNVIRFTLRKNYLGANGQRSRIFQLDWSEQQSAECRSITNFCIRINISVGVCVRADDMLQFFLSAKIILMAIWTSLHSSTFYESNFAIYISRLLFNVSVRAHNCLGMQSFHSIQTWIHKQMRQHSTTARKIYARLMDAFEDESFELTFYMMFLFSRNENSRRLRSYPNDSDDGDDAIKHNWCSKYLNLTRRPLLRWAQNFPTIFFSYAIRSKWPQHKYMLSRFRVWTGQHIVLAHSKCL